MELEFPDALGWLSCLSVPWSGTCATLQSIDPHRNRAPSSRLLPTAVVLRTAAAVTSMIMTPMVIASVPGISMAMIPVTTVPTVVVVASATPVAAAEPVAVIRRVVGIIRVIRVAVVRIIPRLRSASAEQDGAKQRDEERSDRHIGAPPRIDSARTLPISNDSRKRAGILEVDQIARIGRTRPRLTRGSHDGRMQREKTGRRGMPSALIFWCSQLDAS